MTEKTLDIVYPTYAKKYKGKVLANKVYLGKKVYTFSTAKEAKDYFLEINDKNHWIKNIIYVVENKGKEKDEHLSSKEDKYLKVDVGNGKHMLADYCDLPLIQKLLLWNNGYYVVTKMPSSAPGLPERNSLSPNLFGNRSNVLYHVLIFKGRKPEGYTIDHINRNSFDNRRANLRLVSKKTQSFNRSIPAHNKSGIIGVFYSLKDGKRYWVAKWFIDGVQKQKYFDEDKYENAKELAIAWRKKKEEEYFI